MRLGERAPRFDEAFARDLARALHAQAGYLRLPAIDALGIEDVVVTLTMDRSMRLLVSGNLNETNAFVSVRWAERDFTKCVVVLQPEPSETPYTFATMDYSVRGRQAVLETAVPPVPAGQTVTIKALATIGGDTEYRISALGQDLTVAVDALTLLDEDDASA